MRKIVTTGLGTAAGLVLLLSYPTSKHALVTASADTSSGSTGSTGGSGASGTTSKKAATFTGDAVGTRYGTVQVQIAVAGGKITAAEAVQAPSGRNSQWTNRAVPVLNQEAVAAQSANIDTVSGVSFTSDGYVQSLQSAIDQAHL